MDEKGTVSCVVVNISDEKDFEVEMEMDGRTAGEVTVFEVTGNDIKAVNTKDSEGVGCKERKWNGEGKFKFGKHSVTMLRWNTGEKVKNLPVRQDKQVDVRELVSEGEVGRPL